MTYYLHKGRCQIRSDVTLKGFSADVVFVAKLYKRHFIKHGMLSQNVSCLVNPSLQGGYNTTDVIDCVWISVSMHGTAYIDTDFFLFDDTDGSFGYIMANAKVINEQ